DVEGFAQVSQGRHLLEHAAHLCRTPQILHALFQHRGEDGARMDGIHPDLVLALRAFERHRLGDQPYRALGGAVGPGGGKADDSGARGNVDDRAAAGALHRRDHRLHAEEHTFDVDRTLAAELLGAGLHQLMSPTTRLAPSRASSCAVTRPMPELPAPVTIATLPATRPMIVSPVVIAKKFV